MIPRTSWTNVTPLFNCAKMASDVTSDFHGCFVRSLWTMCNVCECLDDCTSLRANLWIAYVQYMSQVPYENQTPSAVIHCEFLWKSVRKFAYCLWQACGIVFLDPRHCLLFACWFILRKSSKRSLGDRRLLSPRNCLRESSNRCAISFERSVAILQQNIPQVHTKVLRIPSNVSAYNLWWFRGWFTEVHKLPRRISWKTYAGNFQAIWLELFLTL